MSVLPSLIAALERAAGDCLVLRSGERPHVIAGETRHDVGTAMLSVKAVDALAVQILSPRGYREFSERSSVEEVLDVQMSDGSLTASAERTSTEIHVELRRHRRRVPEPSAVEVPAHTYPKPLAIVAPLPVVEQAPAVASSNEPVLLAVSADGSPVPAERTDEPASRSVAERVAPVASDAPVSPAPSVIEPIASVVPQMEDSTPWQESAPPRAVAPHADVAAPVPAAAPVRRAPSVVPAPSAGRPFAGDLDGLISDAAGRGATALYLRAGQAPSARIDERLQPLDDGVLSASAMTAIIATCTGGAHGWNAGTDGEWVQELDGAGLVRCYPFADQAGAGVVIRLAPRSAGTGLQRHVPRQIRRACEADGGLVLVAAPTEVDLLAMVAAVADLAASERSGYVICLEPPGGLPHPVAGAFVSARTLGGSSEDVVAAIRRAVQEAPDVLVVGSTESPVAIEEVILSATSPGRLVILGAVAPTALRAVESLLAGVDREREPHLRKALAAALRAAFSYRGLRRLGGGRTIVQDVLVGTSDVRAGLERADFGGIEQMQRRGDDGMRTLDAALARAVARRQVSLRQAAAHATNTAELVSLTRRDARDRRALRRGHRGEWRQGVLRAI